MSEKNVHGSQWTKSSAAAQKQQNYDTTTSSAITGLGGGNVSHSAVASLYGTGAALGLATNIPPHPPDPHSHAHSHSLHLQSPYGNVRFQPPPPQTILHHVGAASSLPPPNAAGIAPTPPSVLLPLGASAVSNVPAASSGGFVPPPFTTTSSTPIGVTLSAAATSVLTPNPFAAVHHHGGGGGNSNVSFGLEGFQHMSAQQQFEFTKMMTAMNTAVSLASVPPSSSSTVPSTSTAAAAAASSLGGVRQHMELSTASGAITSTIAENVINAISVNSPTLTGGISNTNRAGGVKIPDEDKMRRIQSVVETGIGDHAKQQIVQILDRISTLKPMEKLFLYLRMPGEAPETDPLRQPQNPLGTRSEINHTINWVRSHLEHDPQVSIPKQDVYNEYLVYCERLAIKPLSTADFGKVMKQVFPEIRPRRLGTRGHSRYCYAAMRKTTKLSPPQLPQLGTSLTLKTEDGNQTSFNTGMSYPESADNESWEIVKFWAENMLNIKVENMKSLATYIKTNNLPYAANVNVNTHGTVQKKLPQRETKDKRSSGDMGPLKKRRKKKRKGSSSSESSCNQPQQQQKQAENINKLLSPENLNYAQSSHGGMISGDEQKPVQLIEVKQEKLDSPNFQRVEHMASPKLQAASLASCYSDEKPQQQLYQPKNHTFKHNVQQMLPMNLATETRTVLARAPSTAVVVGGNMSSSACPIIPSTSTAVKNLTSKIMDLSSAAASPSAFVSAAAVEQIPIKEEEFVDDYNPNILCKKVRKAQQTKQSLNYWSNSPTPSNIPTTIVTAASPPIAVASSSTSSPSTAAAAATANEIDTSYLMGPPAQITTNASTSPSASTVEGGNTSNTATAAVPKVASRNMLQLRAKKLRYYHIRESMAGSNASPGSDPHPGENATELGGVDRDAADYLGLPRERVISICNMDKHELDDYFLPGEEENSQEQEAELLQYFQTGDAEENPNSSDDAKSNPTATNLPISSNNNKKLRVGQQTLIIKELPAPQPNVVGMNGKSIATDVASNNVYAAIPDVTTATSNTTTTTPAVGSASASLALMSQKHQQQQQQHKQQVKRKINLNAMPMGKINVTTTTRKNCIFLPISPNINNTATSAPHAAAATTSNGGGGVSLFASPGLTRFRPKPALSKQQSLDCDTSSNSDPMIGASRRRKSVYGLNTTVTSASAPPSPSVLQQQQLFATQHTTLSNSWQLSNSNAFNGIIPIVDQNSLDLDLFDAATGNSFAHDSLAIDTTVDCNSLAPLSETQRSQSVPLSQLQRIHSPTFNRSFQTNFSTCTSVAQTPVPSEFADFNMFSENSQQSQHLISNNSNHAIKIEDSTVGVLSSDTTAILDEVDVSDILSSPDFVAKFSSIAQSAAAAATTCSSAGSSSGYSSGACTTFSGANIMGGGGGIISRSVPSTPLPHQQQHNLFGSNAFYSRRRAIDEMHLSPTAAGSANLLCGSNNGAGNVNSSAAIGLKYGNNIQSLRTNYDISKSMPTTPITTPCFRYSPIGYRDFHSNGNTLDSITSLSTVNVIGNDSFISGSSSIGMNALNTDALIDDSFSTEAFTTSTDTDAIMVGADILGNL